MPNRAHRVTGTLILLVLPLAGCLQEPDSSGDTTPPGPVSDLRLESVSGDNLGVIWTAPGDDGQAGIATEYDVRYSYHPITDARWDSCTRIRTGLRPAKAGTRQGVHFDRTSPAAVHVAVKTADEVPNWSPMSNVLTITGPPPQQPDMIGVPAWTFTMGDGVAECGVDQRAVVLTSPLYLGRYEVTNREFITALQWAYDSGYVMVDGPGSSVIDNLGSNRQLVHLGGEDSEILFVDGIFHLRDAGHGSGNGDHPVKEVSWYGAASYCDWLSISQGLPPAYDHATWACNGGDPYGAGGYRLPTDAEWELAAQFADGRTYPWGDSPPDEYRANYGNHVGWTKPVGSYPAGESDLGFHDMAGNIWEWCNDWHACRLGTSPVEDPAGPPTGEYRVVRGGSWDYFVGGHMRCAARYGYYRPWHTNGILGFRCARSG